MMRGNDFNDTLNPCHAWQAIRAIARTTVIQFVVTLLLALAVLLASPLANG